MANVAEETIAVVGGGITGSFCAYVLAQQQGKRVHLFEASDRFGGRIRTIRLNRLNKEKGPTPPHRPSKELEFIVEFGPVRIELEIQRLVEALLKKLGIEEKLPDENETGPAEARLIGFPAFASPTMSSGPKYDLRPTEVGKTPRELFRLAMMRVILHLKVADEKSDFAKKRAEFVVEVGKRGATQEPVERYFTEWMKKLTQMDYWEIETSGSIGNVPLHAMGFWNLLSDYRSHDAITKLRELGTFYHLLPENPNAAEWLVWWLRGFAISDQLQGVHGGMECIVDNLKAELCKVNNPSGTKWLFDNCEVTWLEKIGEKLKLHFDPGHEPPGTDLKDMCYDRVILAVPRSAVEKIARKGKAMSDAEPEIMGLLDSAFGFPMVKMFVVVRNRWWEEENRANRYATRVPTRELHYWKALTTNSKQGLIMAYTDRPASSFWANYVPPGAQSDAYRSRGKPLPKSLEERLKRKVVQYINESNVPSITEKDIAWYGIWDGGREPYGAGNHAWRPERRYWAVMRRLAHIAESPAGNPSIHSCGEAYSDYHGFMEGSLRSAVYTLHRMLDQRPDGEFDPDLPWLTEILSVEKDYLEGLRHWAKELNDEDCTGDKHLYKWPDGQGAEPGAAPERGGLWRFPGSTFHQPPRQVSCIVRRSDVTCLRSSKASVGPF